MHMRILLPCAGLLPVLLSLPPRGNMKAVLPRAAREQFADVPAGVAFIHGERESTEAFFLARTEVSNAQFRGFLADVKAGAGQEVMESLRPGSWNGRSEDPFAAIYYTDRAYDDYPVVNVSREAAMAYCAWMQEKLNGEAPAGIAYGVRLPSRIEWVRAAQGDRGNSPYAWGGPAVQNDRGCMLCNFKASSLTSQRVAYRDGDDGAELTAPVGSYSKNGLGLFNMNGNVAEWLQESGMAAGGSWASTSEEVRNESVMRAQGPSPMVGFRPLVEVVQN